LNKKLERLLT